VHAERGPARPDVVLLITSEVYAGRDMAAAPAEELAD
jgi:hypothetical protein